MLTLQARVLAGGVAVCALCVGSAVFVASRLIETNELHRADERFRAARGALVWKLADEARHAHDRLRLIAELPVLRALLTDSGARTDRSTMDASAEHYRQQIEADLWIVSDADGRVLGAAGPVPGEADVLRLVELGSAETEPRLASTGGRLYLVASEPARFSVETLGVLTAAFQVDDALARELATLTGTEVGIEREGVVLASSLAGEASPGRSTPTAPAPADPTGVDGRRFFAAHYPLEGGAADGPVGAPIGATLVLMVDRSPMLDLLAHLRWRLFWSALATLGLGVAISVVISRRVSGQMRTIARAARDIAAGGWDQRVPVPGGAEEALLARAFNDMTAALVHWYDEAQVRMDRLTAAYERFSVITRSAADAILSLDADGVITLCNP
ncbi:MAG: HAMP domain-containing protein, partial [Vicinamibacterales bacterium]